MDAGFPQRSGSHRQASSASGDPLLESDEYASTEAISLTGDNEYATTVAMSLTGGVTCPMPYVVWAAVLFQLWFFSFSFSCNFPVKVSVTVM